MPKQTMVRIRRHLGRLLRSGIRRDRRVHRQRLNKRHVLAGVQRRRRRQDKFFDVMASRISCSKLSDRIGTLVVK